MTQRYLLAMPTDLDATQQCDSPTADLSCRSLGCRNAVLLVATSLALLLPTIGITFIDRDEGWYARVIREMLEDGDWLVPHYLGEVWIGKPPMLYWLGAISARLLGFGEWQLRLVPVLATTLNCLLVGSLGASLYNRRAGFWAGMAFVAFGLVAVTGRMLLADPILLTCILLAVLMHWRMASDKVTFTRAVLHGLAIGAGLLTKGPVILIFLGAFWLAVLVAYAERRRTWLADWRWWASGLLALLAAVPWYVCIWRQAPKQFVDQFLWFEIVSRVAGDPHGGARGFPGMYVLFSLVGLLPWTGCVWMSVFSAVKRRREDRSARLLLLWIAIPWLFLECLRNNPPHYIVPCYVALAILLAADICRRLETTPRWADLSRGARWALRLSWGPMIGLGGLILTAGILARQAAPGQAAALLGGTMVAGFGCVWYFVRRHSLLAGCIAIVGGTVAMHAVLGLAFMRSLEPARFSRNLAEAINRAAQPGDAILLVGYKEPTVYVYTQPTIQTVDPANLAQTLKAQPADKPLVLAITRKELERLDMPKLQALLNQTPCQEVQGVNYVKRMQPVSALVVRVTPGD